MFLFKQGRIGRRLPISPWKKGTDGEIWLGHLFREGGGVKSMIDYNLCGREHTDMKKEELHSNNLIQYVNFG